MNIIKNMKNCAKKIIGKENFEFINHAKNYVSADFIGKGLGFISIPIFTRLLTPDGYGYLAIFSSVFAIFTVLLKLNMDGAITRYYYEKTDDFKSYVGSILSFVLLFNILAIPLLYLARNFISDRFNIPVDIFVLAIIASLFTLPIRLLMSYYQASKQSKKYSLISVSKQALILPIAAIWTLLLVQNKYFGKMYAVVVVSFGFAVFVVYILLNLSNFKISLKKKHAFYALAFGVPLIPHALSGFILNQFDQLIINQLTGSYNTGLYSFAYKIGMIIKIIAAAMNRSWVPIFFDNYNEEKFDLINNRALKFSKYMFFMALGLILFSQEVVHIMADSSYHAALPLIPVIVIGGIGYFFYLLYSSYAFYEKRTGIISIVTLIAGILNIFLNYLLIPRFGYSIAAFTTLISYFAMFILHYLNVRFLLKCKGLIKFKPIFYQFLVLLFLIISYYILFRNLNYSFILVVKIALSTVGLYWFVLKK